MKTLALVVKVECEIDEVRKYKGVSCPPALLPWLTTDVEKCCGTAAVAPWVNIYIYIVIIVPIPPSQEITIRLILSRLSLSAEFKRENMGFSGFSASSSQFSSKVSTFKVSLLFPYN